MLTGLKFFLQHTEQWMCSKLPLKIPQHLKCLATVIYDLPLITISVSNCHLFSDITISQGSVATRLRCGGIFSCDFTANLSPSVIVKEYWNSVKIWQSYHHEFYGPVFLNTLYIFGGSGFVTEFWYVQSSICVHLRTTAQVCRAISSQLRHILTIGKDTLNSNISPTFSHNMVNFGPLTAEICWRVWGTPANFNGFRVLATLLHGSRVAKVCGVSQSLRRWTEGATYVRQGGQHVGHWPTF